MTQFAKVALLLSLFPLSAVSFGPVPTCGPGWDWTFNSLNQSPCIIASALGEAYIGVDFPIPALKSREYYLGIQDMAPNGCVCSTVFYSLLSACALCQGAEISTWSFYAQSCTTETVTLYGLAQPIPAGFPVPHYAYLDPTANGTDNFDSQLAQADVGPESTAITEKTLAPNSAFPIISPTSAASQTSEKTNTRAIAGGVLGGITTLAITVGIAGCFIARRHRQ